MADKADKELRRMNRQELIEIIYAMQQDEEPYSDRDLRPDEQEIIDLELISDEELLLERYAPLDEESLSDTEALSEKTLSGEEDLPDEKKASATVSVPDKEAVAAERERIQYRRRFRRTLRSTIYALLVVAAIAVLIATLFMPVLQVSGSSMEPTLEDQDIIILFKSDQFETGDLIGFYYQNKLLLKRVIAGPGDVVDIDEEGNVYVNDELLDEPYVMEKALGETDLTYPYQVPESRYFVMGDNRSTSIDSRSSTIGCIEVDQIVGKVFLRIWPLDRFELL